MVFKKEFIDFELENSLPEIKGIELAISDNGCGMDDDTLNKIFDESFSTTEKGTGIGLSLVHSIVQKHGGTMHVDSVLNRGSAFTVSLPIA